jgi:hypothetical protein
MSTSSKEEFRLSNWVPYVEYVPEDYEAPERIFIQDIFNPDMTEMVNKLRPFRGVDWQSTMRTDLLAYTHYKTVTGHWLLNWMNGFTHFQELDEGKLVVIPAQREYMSQRNRSNVKRGEKVVI